MTVFPGGMKPFAEVERDVIGGLSTKGAFCWAGVSFLREENWGWGFEG